MADPGGRGSEGKRILVTSETGLLGRVVLGRLLFGTNGTLERKFVPLRDEARQYDMRLSFLHHGDATDEITYRTFERYPESHIVVGHLSADGVA